MALSLPMGCVPLRRCFCFSVCPPSVIHKRAVVAVKHALLDGAPSQALEQGRVDGVQPGQVADVWRRRECLRSGSVFG